MSGKLRIITPGFTVPAVLAGTLLFSSCWKSKQQLYTTVTNHSSAALHSIEVDYPGGSFGFTDLKPGQTTKKWVFVTPPCVYAVRFVDATGKSYSSKKIDLGKDKCPDGVSLDIDASLNVSGSATPK